jgi:hypothetical protein
LYLKFLQFPHFGIILQYTNLVGTPPSLIGEDGTVFVLPRQDVAMLPIYHATAEDLAIYLYGQILHELDSGYLIQRGIHTMEVTVTEAPGQEATFRHEVATEKNNDISKLGICQFIMNGDVIPKPCLDSTNKKRKCQMKFLNK